MPDETQDPTDAVLFRFVAEFCGWRNVSWNDKIRFWEGDPIGNPRTYLPDYLGSVDAWLRDVWPKVVGKKRQTNWFYCLEFFVPEDVERRFAFAANASARARCLALYRALSGVLPKETQDAR